MKIVQETLGIFHPRIKFYDAHEHDDGVEGVHFPPFLGTKHDRTEPEELDSKLKAKYDRKPQVDDF